MNNNEQLSQGSSNRNKIFIYLGVIVVCIVLVTLAITWQSQGLNQNNESEPTKDAQPAVENPISEIYLNIAQYEYFYRNWIIESKEAATFNALSQAIRMYSLFDYLKQQGIELSSEKEQLQRKLLAEQLSYDLQDPQFKAYFDTMLAKLKIKEQDYIDHYLFIDKKYEILEREMFETGKGLTDDGSGFMSYPSGEQEEKFKNKVGISIDYLEYLVLQKPIRLQPMEPQPALISDGHRFEFAKGKNGELIFTTEELPPINFSDAQRDLLLELKYQHSLKDLSRYNYKQYQELLEQIAETNDQQSVIAKDILALFDIAHEILEMDFGQPVTYHFDELPTFDKNILRKHKDITLKIYEHEYYYRTEGIPQQFYAYRVANEQMVEIYGLFNYLEQNFDFTLDEETVDSLRIEVEQTLQQQMQNAYFKKYIEALLTKFDITIDTYIDDYLLVLAEYETLKEKMYEQHIGLDIKGRYNIGEVYASYRIAANFSWKELYSTMDTLNNAESIEALDPQPELPFDLPEYPLQVGMNAKGDYVFIGVDTLEIWLTEQQQQFLKELVTVNALPPLSRYSIQQYQDALQQMDPNNTMRNQLIEIFVIYGNSI
ncbi:hypothetical protein [Solibacillus daqui]|uniref:hypothetical protein n=1 Tax=Solibacillus daqui TaxID=2912187 RepID=UPI002365C2B6|nr:hypothetical protein [Solibacillus daqui]